MKAIGRLARGKKSFDVVFMDPPYNKEVTTKCLRSIGKYDILNPNAILVIRHSKEESLPPQTDDLILWREEQYGQTLLSLYHRMKPVRDEISNGLNPKRAE